MVKEQVVVQLLHLDQIQTILPGQMDVLTLLLVVVNMDTAKLGTSEFTILNFEYVFKIK